MYTPTRAWMPKSPPLPLAPPTIGYSVQSAHRKPYHYHPQTMVSPPG